MLKGNLFGISGEYTKKWEAKKNNEYLTRITASTPFVHSTTFQTALELFTLREPSSRMAYVNNTYEPHIFHSKVGFITFTFGK